MLHTNGRVGKILIVDDDRIIRAVLCSVFKGEKYSVTEADSGEMALAIVTDVMPDVILLDIMMTGISGFEVLQKIRSEDKFDDIKIILLSAQTDVDERLKGYELGADDYMTKPFFGSELKAKVDVFLRLNMMEENNASLQERVRKEVEKHKQQEEYLLTQAKLISMGDMVRAIAHHWRQPLNALGLIIQDIFDAYTHKELTEEYLSDSVNKSMKHIAFMSEIINNFQEILNDDKSDETTSAPFIIEEVIGFLKHELGKYQVDFSINNTSYENFLKTSSVAYNFSGHPWILKQALTNIIQNSLEIIEKKSGATAGSFKGNIKMKIWNNRETIFISIADNCNAIKEENAERIFEPYFTTKEQDEGMGLSLYFTRMLIEKQLGGKFYVSKADGVYGFNIELSNADNKKTEG